MTLEHTVERSIQSRMAATQIAARSLADLLGQAREALHDAQTHQTQRGSTLSANLMILTWQAPQIIDQETLIWTAKDTQWYLRTFVDRTTETDPLTPPRSGTLLFPYTYAARSRYWDGGWSYLYVLLRAIRAHDFSLERARESKRYFLSMVSMLGDELHLQTVLSLFHLYPYALLTAYLDRLELVSATIDAWRVDTLKTAIQDIAQNPHSRRAVVNSFSYPHLEESLKPQMGKPPYQLFQFLPNDPDAPLSSAHEHRSLDIVGGAQLDFAHDYAWLESACRQLKRPMGDITVIAHNAHEYQDHANTLPAYAGDIAAWLRFVTDGYAAWQGEGARLIKEPSYAANAARIYRRWKS